MREPYIRIGDDGSVTERGGWELPVNDREDTDSGGAGNNGNTPMPGLQEHNFEDDRRSDRANIALILDNPYIKPLN